MAANLIEMFKNTVGDLVIKQASSMMGESAESATKAIGSIIPTLLGTLVQKGGTDAGVRGLMDFMAENKIDGSRLANVSSLLGGGQDTQGLLLEGGGILKYLLGDKLASVVDMISGSSGLKTSSSSSMLKMAGPLLMGILGKYIGEKSLDGQGIKNLLLGQREYVKQGLPDGMSDVLGLGSTLDMGQALSSSSSDTSSKMTSGGSGTGLSKFLPWLVLVLAALGLLYFIQKGCNSSGKPEGEPATTSVDTLSKTAPTSTGITSADPTAKKLPYTLPDGKKLELVPTSFTARIYDFIRGTNTGGDMNARTPNCFRLENVHFVPGTSQLTSQSDESLTELYEVLKNYPVVIVSIEGHTDNVGDPEKNRVYSEQKAQAVKVWLEKKGIAADRLIASGWGDRNPFTDNASEEGKATNRRVEVCVVKK